MKRWIHAATEENIEIYDRVATPTDSVEFEYGDEGSKIAEAIYNSDTSGFIKRYATEVRVSDMKLDENGYIVKDNLYNSIPMLGLSFLDEDGYRDGWGIQLLIKINRPTPPARLAKRLATKLRQRLRSHLSKKLLDEYK